MSGAFPTSPAPRDVKLGSLQPTRVSVSHSQARYTRTLNVQRWMLSLDFADLEATDLAPIFAFLLKQRGQYDTFQFTLQDAWWNDKLGSLLGGTPVVDNEVGSPTQLQTGRALNIRGCSSSITDWAKAGAVFKIAGHAKVYMLTADADTDGDGKTRLVFDPALVESPADGEALTFNDVPFTVSLTRDGAMPKPAPGAIFSLETVELVEAP